jgi:hypothetical protein
MPQTERFEALILGSGNGGMYLAWHPAKIANKIRVHKAVAKTGLSICGHRRGNNNRNRRLGNHSAWNGQRSLITVDY